MFHYPMSTLVMLCLLPGLFTAIAVCICLPMADCLGLPPIAAYLVTPALIIIPFQLTYLLSANIQQTGRWGLNCVLSYRRPLSFTRYIILVPLLAAWSLAAFDIMKPVDTWVAENAFSWLPVVQYLSPYKLSAFPTSQYSNATIALVFFIGILFFGILAPVSEEYYFRAHLLPAMERMGNLAPLVNSLLFALYHFTFPWHFSSLLLAILPAIWFTWRYKNIYIMLWTQITANTLRLAIPLVAIMTTAP